MCRPVTRETASVFRLRSVMAMVAGPNTGGFVPTLQSVRFGGGRCLTSHVAYQQRLPHSTPQGIKVKVTPLDKIPNSIGSCASTSATTKGATTGIKGRTRFLSMLY